MKSDNFWKMSAIDVVRSLRKKEIHPKELIHAAITRIETVDDKINALPIRCFERALEQANKGKTSSSLEEYSILAGLPIAVKDYNDVKGVRTTFGSQMFAKNIPPISDATVALLESRGAIPIAKSNVPEWAGGHTFNPLHGVTRNPWNLNYSAGGSSGGSAAALASGQVWLATGNDLGGSLRTPASFNGVVGLRPSPGIVPRGKRLSSFDTLWVEGPMGRSVADVALMLDAEAGHVAHDPISFISNITSYVDEVKNEDLPKRIAFSPNLNIVPVAKEVQNVSENAIQKLIAAGIQITDQIPDFTGVLEAFHTLRASLLGTMMGDLLKTHRSKIPKDIIDNIEHGFKLSPDNLFKAERIRWELSHRMATFFETHDFLICPSASITPFNVEKNYITHIDGQVCKTYIDWFAITFALTMTACPVISIPCGFSSDNLPIGLQIVGKPRGEASLLQAANQIERIFSINSKLPIDPRSN